MKILPALMLFAIACSQPGGVVTAANETQSAPAGPRVIFPDGFVVSVETVADDELRAQGLMYRDHLQPATGMLFFFAEDDVHQFWMKNTRIPLDMIFIDVNRRIVGVQHEVPPCHADPCPSYGPGLPSRYVLEVGGGVAKQHGLKAGDLLKFEGTEGVVVRD
jgi:uncharacterized membrane protein (UPF0127 family)